MADASHPSVAGCAHDCCVAVSDHDGKAMESDGLVKHDGMVKDFDGVVESVHDGRQNASATGEEASGCGERLDSGNGVGVSSVSGEVVSGDAEGYVRSDGGCVRVVKESDVSVLVAYVSGVLAVNDGAQGCADEVGCVIDADERRFLVVSVRSHDHTRRERDCVSVGARHGDAMACSELDG